MFSFEHIEHILTGVSRTTPPTIITYSNVQFCSPNSIWYSLKGFTCRRVTSCPSEPLLPVEEQLDTFVIVLDERTNPARLALLPLPNVDGLLGLLLLGPVKAARRSSGSESERWLKFARRSASESFDGRTSVRPGATLCSGGWSMLTTLCRSSSSSSFLFSVGSAECSERMKTGTW